MTGMPPEGTPAHADHREQARTLSLEQERNRLKQEVARLRVERDQLARALLRLIPAGPPPPEEAILAQLAQLDQEKPLREFVHEVFKEGGG